MSTSLEDLLYFNSTTADDILALNIANLKGITEWTPNYIGAIEEETIPLLHDIVELNMYGFFSSQSQPGMDDVILEPFSVAQQRSFISGFFKKQKNLTLALVEFMSQQTEYYFCFIDVDGKGFSNMPFAAEPNETLFGKPSSRKIYSLTRAKTSPDEPWDNETAISNEFKKLARVFNIFVNYPVLQDLLDDNYFYLTFASKEWNQGNAVKSLLSFFQQISEPRLQFSDPVPRIVALLVHLKQAGLTPDDMESIKLALTVSNPDLIAPDLMRRIAALGLLDSLQDALRITGFFILEESTAEIRK